MQVEDSRKNIHQQSKPLVASRHAQVSNSLYDEQLCLWFQAGDAVRAAKEYNGIKRCFVILAHQISAGKE